MIRVAAVGDIHMGPDCRGVLRPAFETLPDCADLLLLAGDLTRHGTVEEARIVADEVAGLGVPVIAVLGNHDHHSDQPDEVGAVLADAGVTVLEGAGTVLDVHGIRVGVAGTKGFGGGFPGRSAGEFGEPEMKAFVRYSRRRADSLREALEDLRRRDCSVRVALTHYAPVPDTLAGEPPELYPFLGSYLLAEAIDLAHCRAPAGRGTGTGAVSVDGAGVDLAVHGHAHLGSEHGMTSGGVRVRNVAQPVIRRAFAVYHLLGPGTATRGSVAAAAP